MHRLAQLHQRALERGKVGTILQLLQMAAENIPEAHRIPIETPEDHLHRLLAIADRAVDNNNNNDDNNNTNNNTQIFIQE